MASFKKDPSAVPMPYEVVWAARRGKKFADLEEAVKFARETLRANDAPLSLCVIWEEGIVIGVVTDDADSITLHRLRSWPASA